MTQHQLNDERLTVEEARSVLLGWFAPSGVHPDDKSAIGVFEEAVRADERASLQGALVYAAVPLEVLLADRAARGPIPAIAPSTYETIETGLSAIRAAITRPQPVLDGEEEA